MSASELSPRYNQTGLSESWGRDLRLIGSKLESFAKAVESCFLQLGLQLRDYRSKTMRISQMSVDVAEQLAGAPIASAARKLEESSEQLGILYSHLRHGSSLLISILDEFWECHKQLERFDQIIRILNSVCIMVRVESASFEAGGSDFIGVANNAQQLGNRIESQLADLRQQSFSIVEHIQRELSRLRSLERGHNKDVDTIAVGMNKSFNALLLKQKESASTLKQVADRYHEIASSIGDIVASIQCHDIMRQRLEHIKAALSDAALLVCPEASSEASKESSRISAIAYASHICSLEKEQLANACSDFCDSIAQIRSSLETLQSSLCRIMTLAAAIAEENRDGKEAFFQTTEQALATLTKELDGFAKLKADLDDISYNTSCLIRDIKEGGSALQQSLDETMRNIHSDRIMQDICLEMESHMEGIQHAMRRAFPDDAIHAASIDLAQIETRYTMQQERLVHSRNKHAHPEAVAFDSAQANAAPSEDRLKAKDKDIFQSEHSFGSNVELF